MGEPLTDRVTYCVVKANCSGQSLVTETRDKRDTWTCNHCGAYTTTELGQVPPRPRRYPFPSRGE